MPSCRYPEAVDVPGKWWRLFQLTAGRKAFDPGRCAEANEHGGDGWVAGGTNPELDWDAGKGEVAKVGKLLARTHDAAQVAAKLGRR